MALWRRFLSCTVVSSWCEAYYLNSNTPTVMKNYVCCEIQICNLRMNISHKMFLSYFIKILITLTPIVFFHFIKYNNALATSYMAFTSYPAYLKSLSDFHIMDSRLTMLQTTNGIPNIALYDLVTPNSLYTSATAGKEWYSYFSNQNSLSYNNQYMVINYAASLRFKTIKKRDLFVCFPGPPIFVNLCHNCLRVQ